MTKFVCVIACVTQTTRKGALTRQIPTFYLNTRIQGIVDKEHAEKVARKVINPLDTPAIVIDMTISDVYEMDRD